MKEKACDYDVAVIGAGPAGIMAAIQAVGHGPERSRRVVLLEKNDSPAKKLLLTGGGRCNLTNAEFNLKNLVSNYNNGEFLFHAFSVFGPKQTIEFFNKLGVETKIEKNQKVFPESNNANEVLQALKKYLTDSKVEVLYNSEIKDINFKNNHIDNVVIQNVRSDTLYNITAKKYILATGGKSYSATGSNGFGYKLAEKLGHTIITPSPALTPIKLKEDWVKNLQGISLEDVKLILFCNNKKEATEENDIIFTHFGISGPAVLNISTKVRKLLEKNTVKIIIDLFPLLNQEELLKGLEDDLKKYPKQSIKNILASFVPVRLAEVLLNIAKIDSAKVANNMSKLERASVVKILKNIEVTPINDFSLELGLVTAGGVSLKEIDHKTMKSKIIDNLFFAGEILDVDGKTGGFNLQMCWSTGYLAGQK